MLLKPSLRTKRSNPSFRMRGDDGLLRFARNDAGIAAQNTAVITRESGRSSTPRPLGSITAVSGILGHPPSRVTTTEYDFAFSQRIAPEVCIFESLQKSEGAGNAGCRLAPAVSCARCTQECAHEHTGTAGAARHSLRNGLTTYAERSLETNSSCLHRRRIDGSHRPVGRLQTSASLTPATGARTTRFCRTQLPSPPTSTSQVRAGRSNSESV